MLMSAYRVPLSVLVSATTIGQDGVPGTRVLYQVTPKSLLPH